MPRDLEVRFVITREGLEVLNDHRAVLGLPLVSMPERRCPPPELPSLPHRVRARRRGPALRLVKGGQP